MICEAHYDCDECSRSENEAVEAARKEERDRCAVPSPCGQKFADGTPHPIGLFRYPPTDPHDGAPLHNGHCLICDSEAKLRATLTKINDIRNSIVGYQNVGISQHIYPLVAALEEAGYKGIGYEEAAKLAKTQIQRIEELQSDLTALRAERDVEIERQVNHNIREHDLHKNRRLKLEITALREGLAGLVRLVDDAALHVAFKCCSYYNFLNFADHSDTCARRIAKSLLLTPPAASGREYDFGIQLDIKPKRESGEGQK